jgi:phosphate transport system permease protein
MTASLNESDSSQAVVAVKNPFAETPHERAKDQRTNQVKHITFSIAILLVLPLILIAWLIASKAWPVLSWEYFTGDVSRMGAAGGIWGPLIGTFSLTLVCLLMVAPIGIGAGIYLNEYATDNKWTRAIMIAVTSLAGVPSIVHALFGLAAFVGTLGMGLSLQAAALTLSVMTLPIMIASTREALAAVPKAFREACWNLGASKWQTIRTIVLPNSISGILTGVILVVARAAGETAPIMLTGAAAFFKISKTFPERLSPYGLSDQFMAMSYHLNLICRDVPGMTEPMKFGSAFTLLFIILIINSFAIALRIHLRGRKRW